MAQKSITRYLSHDFIFRDGSLDFNNTMVLSSKIAIFDYSTMMLSDFFDNITMVLLKSKNPTR